MDKKKIFQFNLELYKVTGIQRVILDIHEALRDDFDAKIVGNIPYDKVDSSLNISKGDYLRFKNPFMFHNSVVIIHERRLLPLMWVITHIPWLNTKCIYVHHNELYGNKMLSLFPKKIVAISDAGIKNLTEYFGVDRASITKIHNCVREPNSFVQQAKRFNPNDIKILYPARINSVKRQVEIVKHLKGKLDPRVKILFAGSGPLFEELKLVCDGDNQFQALGFRNDIPSLMHNCDFMMLFSKHEGLPISLIEAAQTGLPAICNNVGGNTEIIKKGINGIIVNDWDALTDALNHLSEMGQDEIDRMSREGKEIYMQNFNFGIFKKRYCNLINTLK